MVTEKVESLISERTQGHNWLSVRDDSASVGVVQVTCMLCSLCIKGAHVLGIVSRLKKHVPTLFFHFLHHQILVDENKDNLSRLRRKVVNDFEPIKSAPASHGAIGAADASFMSLAKSVLVAAIQQGAHGGSRPHILGHRHTEEVIETDKPLFLLGGSSRRLFV